MNHSIRPGQVLYDTGGKRVQAHGGSIFYEEETGTYYFYGENKEFTDGKNGIWTWGVRAYASKDLYNWEDLGLIIAPDHLPLSGFLRIQGARKEGSVHCRCGQMVPGQHGCTLPLI